MTYYALTPEGVEPVAEGFAVVLIARSVKFQGGLLVTGDGVEVSTRKTAPDTWHGRFPAE